MTKYKKIVKYNNDSTALMILSLLYTIPILIGTVLLIVSIVNHFPINEDELPLGISLSIINFFMISVCSIIFTFSCITDYFKYREIYYIKIKEKNIK